MTRLAGILIVIALLSLGMSWLADEPGQVSIDWGVYHIETSVLTLLAILAFLSLLCVGLYWIVFTLLRSPRLFSQARRSKRQSLGITALTETFAAIAAQDVRSARRYLKKAENLLPDQPLTLMLASQVARLEGNNSQSNLYLERMSKTGVTEFLALRGLVESSRVAGDIPTALRHAEKAYAMKPADHWLATTLIGLYSASGRTADALTLLSRAARKRALQADEVHKIRAALLCAEAATLAAGEQWDAAKAALRDALKRNPRFVPAIVQLVDINLRQRDASMAFKIAGDGWKKLPHPEIGEMLLRCYDTSRDRPKAAKLIRKLAKLYPASEEAIVLSAGLAAKEGDYDAARKMLKDLMKNSGETERLCNQLARVEEMAGEPEEEAAWHRRARECPAGAVWNCSSCKRPANKWELSCPQCGSVASIA